jgi:hypothetical protein
MLYRWFNIWTNRIVLFNANGNIFFSVSNEFTSNNCLLLRPNLGTITSKSNEYIDRKKFAFSAMMFTILLYILFILRGRHIIEHKKWKNLCRYEDRRNQWMHRKKPFSNMNRIKHLSIISNIHYSLQSFTFRCIWMDVQWFENNRTII